MKKTNILLPLFAALLFLFGGMANASDDLMEKAQSLFKPIPQDLKEVRGIGITPELVKLGKALYFEPRLSISHSSGTAGPLT